MNNNRGVTLLELLIAVVFVVAVVSSLTFLFPSTSKAIMTNRQRLMAGQLAQSTMDTQKKLSFDALTPTLEINFANNGVGTPKCDCTQEIASMPSTQTVVDHVTYTQQVCVNLVNFVAQTMSPYCPSGLNNPPMKHIHVRVSWTVGTNNYSTDLDSMVTSL